MPLSEEATRGRPRLTVGIPWLLGATATGPLPRVVAMTSWAGADGVRPGRASTNPNQNFLMTPISFGMAGAPDGDGGVEGPMFGRTSGTMASSRAIARAIPSLLTCSTGEGGEEHRFPYLGRRRMTRCPAQIALFGKVRTTCCGWCPHFFSDSPVLPGL